MSHPWILHKHFYDNIWDVTSAQPNSTSSTFRKLFKWFAVSLGVFILLLIVLILYSTTHGPEYQIKQAQKVSDAYLADAQAGRIEAAVGREADNYQRWPGMTPEELKKFVSYIDVGAIKPTVKAEEAVSDTAVVVYLYERPERPIYVRIIMTRESGKWRVYTVDTSHSPISVSPYESPKND